MATLYIISAPSGCGKTSLIKALITSTQQVAVSVSYTTRKPRSSEVTGVDYQFVTVEHFLHIIREDGFLEYAQVFDHYYGTSYRWVEMQLQQGIDVIMEIDWQGAQQVKRRHPAAVSIFILPPSIHSLYKRLMQRGEDSTHIIETRIKNAQTDISHAREYEYIVINAEFNKAVSELKTIIEANRLHTHTQLQMIDHLLSESL